MIITLKRASDDVTSNEIEQAVGISDYNDWYIAGEFFYDSRFSTIDPTDGANLAAIIRELETRYGKEGEVFYEAKLPDRSIVLVNPANEAAVRAAQAMSNHLDEHNLLLGAEDLYIEQLQSYAAVWWEDMSRGERICRLYEVGGDPRDAFSDTCPDCLLEAYAKEAQIPYPLESERVLDARGHKPFLVVFDDYRQHTMLDLDGLKELVLDIGSWLRFMEMLKGGPAAVMHVKDQTSDEPACLIKVITDNSPLRPAEPEYAIM